MAEVTVRRSDIEAGRAYLEALGSLGFEPHGVFWSIDLDAPELAELSVLTGLVDSVGTLSLYEVLFALRETGATPASLDPWQIALYGPGQLFHEAVMAERELIAKTPVVVTMGEDCWYRISAGEEPVAVDRSDEPLACRLIRPEWIYRLRSAPPTRGSDGEWTRLRNAAVLAA